MTVAPVLEHAPFTSAQRAWLSTFLTGVLGLEQTTAIPQPAGPAAPPPALYTRQHPFAANVLQVQPLTRHDSPKDVRLVRFDLRGSGLQYMAGDSLGVYPENCSELVELILGAIGATGDEPVQTPHGQIVAARDALLTQYDIVKSSDELLALLAQAATDPGEAKRLQALAEGDEDDALTGHDIFDLLTHFPSARPVGIASVVAALAPLQPRLYSISSSPQAHPEEVHLTVGVVRYARNGCDRMRKGVASTFLTERVHPGQKVRLFVQPSHGFRLPANGHTPIIMVGPGTGIAPFRAFLQERQASRASGKNWLFFGNQRRVQDFLYQEELEQYLRSGVLTRLDTAFSRDQAEKIYVQQRMCEQAAEIWAWLQHGAHVYVCGDAKRMARDVDQALHTIVMEQGHMSATEAKAYMATLVRTKRYQRDVY